MLVSTGRHADGFMSSHTVQLGLNEKLDNFIYGVDA